MNENLKIGDEVNVEFSGSNKIGIIKGFFKEDERILDQKGVEILFAKKDDVKVHFNNNVSYVVYSKAQLKKI